ncbi:MAG TPA: hypothetical protein VKV02_04795 [Acidobacteriaceae bacterium]|nr:hypothetical protein [Acidobacteriaceae bacterium]
MFEIKFPITAAMDLFESGSIQTGMTKAVPGGATIQLRPMGMEKRSFPGAAMLFTAAVTGLTSVGLNLFSSWLYDKLKNRGVCEVTINRRVVEVTPDGIRRAIEETIMVRK